MQEIELKSLVYRNPIVQVNKTLDISLIFDDLETLRDKLQRSLDALVVDILALEVIPAFSVITSEGRIADSINILQKNKIVGITRTDSKVGFRVDTVAAGLVKNKAWNWMPGDKIFLNGTDVSNTSPGSGFSVLLGTATDIDEIDVNIQPSVLL